MHASKRLVNCTIFLGLPLSRNNSVSLIEPLEPLFYENELGSSPFRLHHAEPHPGNILVDGSKLIDTGVLDWEFTYTAPIEYTYAAPWWPFTGAVYAAIPYIS